jgi:hypothetical protein
VSSVSVFVSNVVVEVEEEDENDDLTRSPDELELIFALFFLPFLRSLADDDDVILTSASDS